MRKSYGEQQMPTGKTGTPYPDHSKINNEYLRYGVEKFEADVTGAGGAGGSFVCPFEPAEIEIDLETGPRLARSKLGGTPKHTVLDTAAYVVNANPPTVAPVDAADPSKGYTVTLPTQMAPDGDVSKVTCTGYRDVGGSL